jgi:hypothetical protein
MAGIGDIFSSIKKAISPMGKAPAKQGVAPSVKAGARPGTAKQLPRSAPQTGMPRAAVPGPKKPFDINVYMKAVSIFFDDFFKKKVPMFFKNPGPYLKKAPDWFKTLPQDEQISYGALVFGHVLFIVGIVLFIVL